MIIPFETVSIPETSPEISASEHFRSMVEDGLPAFVTRNAGRNFREALLSHSSAFTENGFDTFFTGASGQFDFRISKIREALRRLRRQGSTASADFGAHIDSFPEPNGQILRKAKSHYTKLGRAVGNFFEPADDFAYTYSDSGVPAETGALLAEGLVDDGVLIPVNHRVELGPRDLLVFRFAGKKPLVHSVISLSEVRAFETAQVLSSQPMHTTPSVLGLSA